MEAIVQLFRSHYKAEPLKVEVLTGSGSNRQYFRLSITEHETVIGVMGTSQEENNAFITLSHHFCQRNLPVPKVLAVSTDQLTYLQEDLGTVALFDALQQARAEGERNNTDANYGETEYQLLAKTIRLLPHFQIRGAEGLDFSQCYPQPEMDEMNVMFDLNYFKYCFLKPSGVAFHEVRLEHDFRDFAHTLCAASTPQTPTFLYRDFQARNVMLVNGTEPYFIDFQGGRKGPIYYDLASFLWQASARYPQTLRNQLLAEYEDELRQLHWPLPAEGLQVALQPWVLFRLLQVLGAYGYRGYFERKQHFLNSIPQAIANLRILLNNNGCPFPHLRQVLASLVQQQQP